MYCPQIMIFLLKEVGYDSVFNVLKEVGYDSEIKYVNDYEHYKNTTENLNNNNLGRINITNKI